jgi:hypothetical protein
MNLARSAFLLALGVTLTAGVSAESIVLAAAAKKGEPRFAGKILHFAVIKPGALSAGREGDGLFFPRAALGPLLTTVRTVQDDAPVSARCSVRQPVEWLQKPPMAAADANKAAMQSQVTAARPVVFPVDTANVHQH